MAETSKDKKKKKEKIKIIPKKYPSPEQDPKQRINNFSEVALGLDEQTAIKEAQRCLFCKKAPCIPGCPVEIDIPGFLKLIIEGKFVEAARKIKEKNALPAICGRVCPQETQCEVVCALAHKFEPVAIGRLERFVADYERKISAVEMPQKAPATGMKVAVVGAGPAGLTVAADLVQLGHQVTIFESLHLPGGVLVYGIPEFRLPKEIVKAEVDYLQRLGVKIVTNFIVGKTASIDELFGQGYDAIFLGCGAGLPYFMGIEGENASGVYSANEFLTRVNLMRAYEFPKSDTPIKKTKVYVTVGGGNTAMDAARVSLRLGAERSILVYRRSEKEMPARIEEIEHAKEEGVEFHLLRNPKRIITDEKNRVKAMEIIKMELGEPDESGRRRPVPIEGSEYIIDCDVVIVAIGQEPNPLITKATPGLKLGRKNTVVIDKETGQTSIPGVFAGGDIVTGGATVILAMGQARVAGRAMHQYLMKKKGERERC